MKSTAYLNEALTDPVSGPSYAVEASPFYRMQGCTVFDHYASVSHLFASSVCYLTKQLFHRSRKVKREQT